MTRAFKHPDCPTDFNRCGFKTGSLDMCDGACNEVVATEPCSQCHKSPAQCTVFNKRVCYDCASKVYEDATGRQIK